MTLEQNFDRPDSCYFVPEGRVSVTDSLITFRGKQNAAYRLCQHDYRYQRRGSAYGTGAGAASGNPEPYTACNIERGGGTGRKDYGRRKELCGNTLP